MTFVDTLEVQVHPAHIFYIATQTLRKEFTDVSSLQQQTAGRDHSQRERESERETANQSRVNSLAGQWEPGGENTSRCSTPPPPIESCLEVPGGGVAERGEGEEGAGRAGPGEAVQGKTL